MILEVEILNIKKCLDKNAKPRPLKEQLSYNDWNILKIRKMVSICYHFPRNS